MWGSETEKKEFGALFPLFYGSREERNYGKGIKSVKKLAAGGYVPAVCQLGIAYFDHLGVHRNYSEAFRFYMEAALQDYPSAECAVGNFYAMVRPRHEACGHDPEEAARWWLRASGHGNAGAQCNLANVYLTGLGVDRNPVEAYVWASMAVHCSSIRFRSAEVYRDQGAEMIIDIDKENADRRIEVLKKQLPFAWSDHLVYWTKLYE